MCVVLCIYYDLLNYELGEYEKKNKSQWKFWIFYKKKMIAYLEIIAPFNNS